MKDKDKVIEILYEHTDQNSMTIGEIEYDEIANRLCEPSHQSAPTVEEIVEILIETLNLDGNRGGHSYWIDLESEKDAARTIHKFYERGGER